VAYAALAPGAGQTTYGEVLRGVATGQAFLLLKLFLRLSLLGGQTALYVAHDRRPEAPAASALAVRAG
jgi:hypothetical protein